jgi:nucleoside-diphosphate-sugar epimerase
VVREPPESIPAFCKDVACVGGVGAETDWASAVDGIGTVVHLAAHVHVGRHSGPEGDALFYRVNVDGTRTLASAAAAAGVRRFVFLSSIKVNGDSSVQAFTEADIPGPADAYGMSKWHAEQELRGIAEGTQMQWVVLRPPLVFGPGVKANFLRLLRAVDRRLPLPIASVRNRRSLLYVGNLVDAITTCMTHREAANRLFLVSDGEDVSTPDLVRRLARALGVQPWLVAVPPAALRVAGRMIGRSAAVERLLGTLQVNTSRLRTLLDWAPPFTLDQGLAETARWYRGSVAKPA